MNKKELISIKSLQINLKDESSTKLCVKILTGLKNKGYERVTIEIKTSTEEELKKSGLDIAVFNKVKDVQDLPDWVIINMILAGGKLKGTKFKARSVNE
jgi:hypothetical protein